VVGVVRGNVKGRIAVEEADRSEGEAAIFDRHHRPVLRAGEVDSAEGVPHDDILAIDRPILGYELRQPSATGVLVDQISGRKPLGRVVASDPWTLRGEGRAAGGR
jgi:hypothetical protein